MESANILNKNYVAKNFFTLVLQEPIPYLMNI